MPGTSQCDEARAHPAHAFHYLGYDTFKQRYGVKYVNVMARPFERVDLGEGVTLNFNTDIINSDFVVDLPPMKSHNQTVVSLGMHNALKISRAPLISLPVKNATARTPARI